MALALLATLTSVPPVIAAGNAPPEPTISEARPDAAILVTYQDHASARRGRAVPSAKLEDEIPELNVKVFRANRGQERKAMRDLAASTGVVTVESDVVVEEARTPNDPLWPTYNRWAHDKVSLRSAWDRSRGTSAIRIAILDSGLSAHPEFTDRVYDSWDFVDGDWIPNDPRGHGTMSAGAAAARGNNGLGVAGGCWGCRIMPVRVLNSNGTGYGSWVVKGLIYAANHGADVISMSFGGFLPTTAMGNAVLYARSKGAVVLGSAGNDGNTKPFYPGAYPGVISVAASNSADQPYSWSNRGAWVDLTAPGCFWTTTVGRSYGNFCGTSASTPLVAGIVGIMRAKNPYATVSQVEQALLGTATPMTYVKHGRPNAAAAVQAIAAVPKPTTPAYLERGGQVVIEAERANRRIGRAGVDWINGTIKPGFVGGAYVAAWADTGWEAGAGYPTSAAELRYQVKFTTPGIYTVWIRTWAPNGRGNTVHAGRNGRGYESANRIASRTYGTWSWTRRRMDRSIALLRVPSAGVHTINIWAREDGFRFDRIMLTRNGNIPYGVGPRQSQIIGIPIE
jgi:hypothetical protein